MPVATTRDGRSNTGWSQQHGTVATPRGVIYSDVVDTTKPVQVTVGRDISSVVGHSFRHTVKQIKTLNGPF